MQIQQSQSSINGTVLNIDPSTNTISANLSLNQVPGVLGTMSIAVNSDNSMIYTAGVMLVGTDYQEAIFVVNPFSPEHVGTIIVNLSPGGLNLTSRNF